jgi:hypothetical protein
MIRPAQKVAKILSANQGRFFKIIPVTWRAINYPFATFEPENMGGI